MLLNYQIFKNTKKIGFQKMWTAIEDLNAAFSLIEVNSNLSPKPKHSVARLGIF